MSPKPFSTELLKPLAGTITYFDRSTPDLTAGTWSIVIPLAAEDVSTLADRTFRFPINPAEGYIDGSMYLCGAHNPVDVTRIEFDGLEGTSIAASLACDFIFDYELRSVFGNTHADLVTMISFSPG